MKLVYKNKKLIQREQDSEVEKQIMKEIDETLIKRTYKKYGIKPPKIKS